MLFSFGRRRKSEGEMGKAGWGWVVGWGACIRSTVLEDVDAVVRSGNCFGKLCVISLDELCAIFTEFVFFMF